MDKELQDLKSVLRSLVVSSPAQMDVQSLARDYRAMMGGAIPFAKHGYNNMLAFLKERCGDCFLFQGLSTNPVLTLIVPDSLKHIDQFVQRQKPTAITKMKGKRRSATLPPQRPNNLICQSYTSKINSTSQNIKYHPPERKSNYHSVEVKSNYQKTSLPEGKSNCHYVEGKSNYHSVEGKSNYHSAEGKSKYHLPEGKSNQRYQTSECKSNHHPPEVRATNTNSQQLPTSNNVPTNNKYNRIKEVSDSMKPEMRVSSTHIDKQENGHHAQTGSKKRVPTMYLASEQCTEIDKQKISYKDDDDSGRLTSSSQSSTRKGQLEIVQCEIHELIKESENGILCTDILSLYREWYRRELDLSRLGYHNINGLLCSMGDRVAFSQEAGGVRVRDARQPPPPSPPPHARPPRRVRPPPLPAAPPAASPVDPDDALPGIDYDAGVFPADCMHFTDSIPALPVEGLCAGAMLEVTVGEVYSPSHFWLQRVGPAHSAALDDIMDNMSVYYHTGAGRERVLSRGAVRPLQYCASLYDRDWHRSLIVKVLDADTVKVRHVDYGTVDVVPLSGLKPLLLCWAALPAQALRARLAGLRPGAGGRRWPHAAASHFLSLVRDKRFIANVVAVDPQEDTIETFLIDTSGADDVCVSAEMIRAGYADARTDSALRSGECYLYPLFAALESGATPNYGEIHRYLADGISLEYVEAYRKHVPAALPALRPAPSAPRLVSSPAHCSKPASPPIAPYVVPSSAPACIASPVPVPAPPAPAPLAPASSALAPPNLMQPALLVPDAATTPAPSPIEPSSCWVAGAPPAPPPPWKDEVRLTCQECEIYALLSQLDPDAAHCYMRSTLRRASTADNAATRQHAPAPPSYRASIFRAPPFFGPPPSFGAPAQHAFTSFGAPPQLALPMPPRAGTPLNPEAPQFFQSPPSSAVRSPFYRPSAC